MSKNLHIACSPLTGTIFAGKVLKKGVWAQGKQDLTIEALFAVAEHVTHFGKPVELSDTSGKLLFKIFVDRPAEKQFMTQKSEPSATEPMMLDRVERKRKMSNYKLVPWPPTAEMVEAAEDAHMPFGDMGLSVRLAILAAPAVQAEAVAYAVFAENGNIRIWCSDPIQAETLRQQYGEALQPLYAAPQPAEQHPDVTQLVEALDLALEYWRDRQQRYKNRRPKWVIAAESALAAHRKGDQP